MTIERMDRHINVIAFNIPYPPDYGGIIDIYYKIESLHKLGVKVLLHCFEYERAKAEQLEAVCEKVYYYKRNTGLAANLCLIPYNVNGRKDPLLLQNLLDNSYPALFEGFHSCYYLSHPELQPRVKFLRAANIEHDYYRHLAGSTGNMLKKVYYAIEAYRFKRYQYMAKYADAIMAVSNADKEYFSRVFPTQRTEFIPCFHPNEQIVAQTGKSDYILYHGKLSVEENERAAIFLAEQVFGKLAYKCIIAGMNPSGKLKRVASRYPNISLEANPGEERMRQLIREAHVHTLVTFQDTGLKLKLLNSLFAGRHIVVNDLMLKGSGLDSLCHIANTPQDMLGTCRRLMEEPFSPQEIQKRQNTLFPQFSNLCQAKHIIDLIDQILLLRRERMPETT